MNKTLISFLLIIAVLSSTAAAQASDLDKLFHVLVGGGVQGVSSMSLSAATNTKYGPEIGLGLAAAAGIGKEVFDSRQKHNRFDPIDMAATIGGGLAGYASDRLAIPWLAKLVLKPTSGGATIEYQGAL